MVLPLLLLQEDALCKGHVRKGRGAVKEQVGKGLYGSCCVPNYFENPFSQLCPLRVSFMPFHTPELLAQSSCDVCPGPGWGGWVMQAVRMHVLDCSVLWDSEELWVSCAMLSFQVGWSRGCVQCTAGLVPSSHQDTSWQDMVTSAPFAPTSPPEQPTRQVGNAPSQMHSAFFQLLGHFSSCDWSVLWSHSTEEQEGSQHLLVSHFLFKMPKSCLVRPCGEREYVEGKGWQGEERNPYIPEAPLTWK